MKKRDLTTLALLGISAGLFTGGCASDPQAPTTNANESMGSNQEGSMAQKSEEMKSFYSSLNPSAKQKFEELDAKHKMMAMEMAKQNCNGQNHCKGMGGCKTAEHMCAGLNSCAGKGGPPVKNPNKTVEVQYQNQKKETGQ